MKTLLLVSALALAAASQAEAAPNRESGFYQGSWTCTVAHAPQMKLFMTARGSLARAAVRQYPYYGQTNYDSFFRVSRTASTVSFRGTKGFISLRATARDGVMQGTARIGTAIMLLTCARG